MSLSEARLPPGELQRLAECVLEPIRFPGAIQPHGVLFAVEPGSLVITHVSDNTQAMVGADPVALLGRPLSDLLDPVDLANIESVLAFDSNDENPTMATVGGRTFEVISRHAGDTITVELEPHGGPDKTPVRSTRHVMRRMAVATTAEKLLAETARGLRAVIGFDRVVVYHFHPDGHGEIVGEAKADDMEPYLGLHYPASDIPAQARALYLTSLSRLIADSWAEPATLLSDANRVRATDFDLSGAELRAVSPHHLEFMRNMGQVSTFTLSMVSNGVLVGMITCSHREQRMIGYNLRNGLEILATQLALQLASFAEIDRLTRRDETRQIRSALLAQVAGSSEMSAALLDGALNILDLIPADGAAVRINGRIATIGMTPPRSMLDMMPERVAGPDGVVEFVSDAVPIDYPELGAAIPGVGGLLMHRIGSNGDFIVWFRGEIRHTIEWLGDMSLDNRETPLSARSSFSAWREEVSGISMPWGELEDEARELTRDLESALLAQAQARLAEQALRDSLTGLANRRLFMDHLEQALTRRDRGDQAALLFIDVDRFKSINDTHGHAAGDAALVRIADALRNAARSSDTVARLGGDEFVVLCEGSSLEIAQQIADRIRAAVASSITADAPWAMSVSIGIAMADLDFDSSHWLNAADAAMYRAKAASRGTSADPND